jgi:hypothetical protein
LTMLYEKRATAGLGGRGRENGGGSGERRERSFGIGKEIFYGDVGTYQ